MITEKDCEEIERGKHHCFITKNTLECRKCGGQYKMTFPIELWALQALTWGFCKEHADCGEDDALHG